MQAASLYCIKKKTKNNDRKSPRWPFMHDFAHVLFEIFVDCFFKEKRPF